MRGAAAEERVLALLAEREEELVAFAGELIATPSPNPPGDERAVVGILSDALRSFGYRDLRILAVNETRPNLLARIGGPGGRALVFSGHVDTKPTGDEASWRTPPYQPTIIDGRLHGLGAADMKAALAAMVFAGRALSDAKALDGELRLVLTADEEAGAALGAKFLVDQLEDADGILVGEPTGVDRPWEYLAVASRGVACFRVVVRGTQLHSALTDRLPSVNASVKLAKLLSAFADNFHPRVPAGSPWTATANPGVTLEGGIFYGVCPGEASFGVDVRTVPGMTLEALQSQVAEFITAAREADADLVVEVEWPPGTSWFPPSAVDPMGPLLCAARSAVTDTLHEAIPDGIFPGGTEGAIWAERGIPVLPALGPGRLTEAHRPNESVGVAEIVSACQIYALTAMRFLSK
jgi:acetylornithine deacetylase/succinyl-diaminopimelate desuccinylase-like protein